MDRHIRARSGCDSKLAELQGFVEIGMHREAKRLARNILRKTRLSGDEFSEALAVLLEAQNRLKPSAGIIEAAYQRLARQDRRRVRSSMLGFYYSLKDFKKAHPFASVRPHNPLDFKFSIEVFEVQGDRSKAERLARLGCRWVPRVKDEFSRASMLDALAKYMAGRGEHRMALDLLGLIPTSAETIFNTIESTVKLHAAEALLALRNGLKTLGKLKKDGDPTLALSHPGLNDVLVQQVRERLLKRQRAIEKLLPKVEWKELGLGECSEF